MRKSAQIKPVPHGATDGYLANGWGGKNPLPVTKIDKGYQTAWVPSREALRILKNGAISLVITIGPNGPEVSMEAVEVKLT